MATIKLTPTITDISGTINGTNFTKHSGKNVIRKKLTRTDADTTAQNLQRNYFLKGARLWDYVAPVIKQSFSSWRNLNNLTEYNKFIKINTPIIAADGIEEIATGGTLTLLTTLYSIRPKYGGLTYLYWNPGELGAGERAQLIIIEKGVYGNVARIERKEYTGTDVSPQIFKGYSDSDRFNFICYKTNGNFSSASLYSDQISCVQDGAEMSCPIGSILPWHKSLTGCPSLPAEFVECNGQTLSDADSPFNGQVIPNLNGAAAGANSPGLARKEKMFLRGDVTSGTGQDDATGTNGLQVDNENAHTHGKGTLAIGNHSNLSHTNNHSHDATKAKFGGSGWPAGTVASLQAATINAHGDHTLSAHTVSGDTGAGSDHSHSLTISGGGDNETRPPNMTVVMIMRIK